PPGRFAGHFHDTAGKALKNIETSLEYGIQVFDTAVGGLGGCPYAPGAKGNVDTLAVAARLNDLGFETGLSFAPLLDAASFAKSLRGAA
ncbi:MAG: hydroxymethylglutaryl-CoA lyase, partial [Pseudomonadota bacterium]